MDKEQVKAYLKRIHEKNEYPIEGYEDWTTADFLDQYDLNTVIRMFLYECSLFDTDTNEYTYETALEGLMQQMAAEDIPAKEALKNWLYEYFDKYELLTLQAKVDEV